MMLKKILADTGWAERPGSAAWRVGLTTFGILALELALIRWTSSQVRVFAYFNNLVLIGAFLGMGLGVALGRRWPGLVHLALPALLALAVPLAFSEQLGLVHLQFPDRSIMLWGADQVAANGWIFARSLAVFIALLVAVVGVFVCCGAPLGVLFARLPALRAYHADLLGSLVGVAVFTAASWLDAGPGVWLLLGGLPFAVLARTPLALGAAVVVAGLGWWSEQGAMFSPYNRIVLNRQSASFLELQVNRDFHQYMVDLSERRIAAPALPEAERASLRSLQDLYDLPFKLNASRRSALVVGAGTGNDVQAALRNGYARVTSVDIDGRIIALGRAHHPEAPYASAAVRPVVDDARAFFEKNRDEKFDVVCFGLLDSHAMSSAMSTLRLDNYVYTEEGIRAAWNRVGPDGHLSLAISCIAGRWFFERLYWTITRATGREPIAFYSPLHYTTATFVVPRPGAKLDEAAVAARAKLTPTSPMERVATTSDDWPFLHLRPGVVPWGYLAVIGAVLALAAACARPVFGLGAGGGKFHRPLFLMGAAFLLIETRGVTSLSLLFGSTWVVNSAVFAGILLMVLAGNAAVQRWQWTNPRPWFGPLLAAVALLYFFPMSWLHSLPLGARGLVGGLLTGLPIGLAGVIVPMLLARAANPAAALGANLLGAVLGGCLEYFSMLGGLGALALLAAVLYLGALWDLMRERRVRGEV